MFYFWIFRREIFSKKLKHGGIIKPFSFPPEIMMSGNRKNLFFFNQSGKGDCQRKMHRQGKNIGNN